MSDPNRASPGIKSYVSQWTGYGAKQEKPGHEASKVPSKNLAEKKKTHSWISKFQRRARQVIKLRRITGSSLPTQRSSITDETSEPAFPPRRSLFPFPRVTSPVSFLPLPGPEIPSSKLSPPVEEPLSTPPPLDLPSLQPSPTGPAALDEGEAPVTNGWRPINATTELNDLCFEFLQVDDRPTVIMEVKPKPEATKTGDVMVDILFTNPAFEHLKPQLKLDFKSPEELGGMLKRSPSPVEWTVENDDWQLRCVGVGRDTNGGWAKVLTVGPVMESLHGDLEGEDAGIRTDNEEEEYLGSRGNPDLQRRAVPLEYHLENYGGGGVGDVRRMSITEESPQGSSGSDVTALGLRLLTTDGTSSSTKTITPNYSRAPTARGSLASSSNSTSRRSSRSLPCSRRGSSPLGIPESPSARSESNERRPGDKPNMDWTRGAILQKNTQNLEGMDDHLNFLMKAPWHQSPMGPPQTWPVSLRCVANVVMSFPHPAMVYWGKELIAVYNPQAKILAGDNHPAALGQPFAVGFPKFKEYMMPMLQAALDGKTTLRNNEQIFVHGDVPVEERYYNFIISPIIGASGSAEGVLKQAHSRTSQVIQARRMETLHKIRANVELIRDLDRDNFWNLVLEGLGSNEIDTPFALLYRVISEKGCVLAGSLGIPEHLQVKGGLAPGEVQVGGKTTCSSRNTYTGTSSLNQCDILSPSCPRAVSGQPEEHSESMNPAEEENTGTTSSSSGFGEPDEQFLFYHEMILARESNSVVVKSLETVPHTSKKELSEIQYRGFGDPCTHVAVIPIQPSPSRTFGYLILGLNPRRPYDHEYFSWLTMLMEQLATSLGRVRLLTEDLRRAVQEARHQKQLASQALERKRQQENFIDISSHELRNPLSAVLQSAEGILGLLNRHKLDRSQVLDIEQITDSAQTILLCVNHQRIIIEDILAVSKLDSNLMTVAPVPTDPRNLMWKGLKMFEAEFAGKGIYWEFRVLEGYDLLDISWVNIDPSRTTQILVNLVANAIKFTALKEGEKKICVLLDASLESPTNWSNFDYLPTEKIPEQDAGDAPDWGTGQPLFLTITVKDTGIGISKQNKRNLFQRFNQVPKTHITYGGSGLGLYISRRLCQLQGGNIGVSSVEGEGSIFRFYIKACRAAAPPTPAASVSIGSPTSTQGSTQGSTQSKRPNSYHSSPGGVRSHYNPPKHSSESSSIRKASQDPLYHVLVVEDNLINQKVLRQQLVMEGCVVDTANNGQEALEKIMQSRFVKKDGKPLDVVLMDMEMPVMGGVEATKRIRQLEVQRRTGHIPIIGISANARSEQLTMMTAAGMDDAIPKPFRIPELLGKFKTLI